MLNCATSAAPTAYVSIATLEWMLQGAHQYHLDLDNILRDCGLPFSAENILSGAVSCISTADYCRLYYQLHYRLQMETCRSAGLRGISREEFQMMCYCLITSETLGEAISRARGFFEMLRERFPSACMNLREKGSVASFELNWGLDSQNDMTIEMEKKSLYLFYYFFSWLTGRPIPLLQVTLNAPPKHGTARLAAMFGCAITTEQSSHSFQFTTNLLDRPNIRSYSELKRFFEYYPSLLLLPVNIGQTGTASQLKQIMLNICLKEGNFPCFSRLAELYDTSESSLSRRLRRENSSYSLIKESCQFDIAKEYMWRPELSIADVASLLGFSDANSFSRSFRKWSGQPPATFRRQMLQTGNISVAD